MNLLLRTEIDPTRLVTGRFDLECDLQEIGRAYVLRARITDETTGEIAERESPFTVRAR